MSWLSKMFKGGGGSNPADAAMPYINQIPGTAKQELNPYIQRGQTAYDVMSPQWQKMAQDPTAFLDEIMKGYAPSEAYKTHRDEAMRAAGNTAAAGGMRGSSQDTMGESRLVDSLLGEDMQQWLNNVLGLQKQGLEGEKGLYDTGFEGSKALESDLVNSLAQQGNLAYAGQAERNKSKSDMWQSILQGIGGIGGLAMPGGGSLAGNLISKWM